MRIHERGLRVPYDISVVGFDNVRAIQFMTPAFTTMNDPSIEHGQLPTEILMALISGEAPTQKHIHLETQLLVRDSCGGQQYQN